MCHTGKVLKKFMAVAKKLKGNVNSLRKDLFEQIRKTIGKEDVDAARA